MCHKPNASLHAGNSVETVKPRLICREIQEAWTTHNVANKTPIWGPAHLALGLGLLSAIAGVIPPWITEVWLLICLHSFASHNYFNTNNLTSWLIHRLNNIMIEVCMRAVMADHISIQFLWKLLFSLLWPWHYTFQYSHANSLSSCVTQ
jgi:hypothetical protein